MDYQELRATIAAEALHKYIEESCVIQKVIEDMVDIMMDDEATVQEYNMARDTLIEMFFPKDYKAL